MKKKWLVTYYGPEGKWLGRWFRTLTEASLFRDVMRNNISIRDRDSYTATVWHLDDLK